jgi:hypothetical protein
LRYRFLETIRKQEADTAKSPPAQSPPTQSPAPTVESVEESAEVSKDEPDPPVTPGQKEIQPEQLDESAR